MRLIGSDPQKGAARDIDRHQPDPYLSTSCAATAPADALAELLLTCVLDKGLFTKTTARPVPQHAARANRTRRRALTDEINSVIEMKITELN